MRLKLGSSVRLVLNDGTTVEGLVRPSWRARVIKLEDVVSLNQHGNINLDGHLLVPVESVLFAQVGA
jgi:hypothetical protein